MAYELPKLAYATDALEPHMDKATVEVHHGRHHATYLNNLNKALESATSPSRMPVETLLKDLSLVPAPIREVIQRMGGGYLNHNLWWEGMGPGKGGAPTGRLVDAIKGTFGGFDTFKELMSVKANAHFGSGWGWLVENKGKLEIVTTANQDCPLTLGMTPLLALDVWEHAYYLKYQNRRADFIGAWWNLVDWDVVAKRLP